MTPERIKYHEMMERFKTYIPKGCTIWDIGKSVAHDYKKIFKDYDYKTVDRDKTTNPDIFLDLEKLDGGGACILDAVLCNGVTEQCSNPFDLLKGVESIIKVGGYGLYGVLLTSYPLFGWDNFRFTESGILLQFNNFDIIEKELVYRNDVPSYIYLICKKKAR